jgi:hypothetical protein
MKATERAKTFRDRDRTDPHTPWPLRFLGYDWMTSLGIGAIGFAIMALVGSGGMFWLLAALCAVGAVLSWVLVHSA